jgi:hypothetical protein
MHDFRKLVAPGRKQDPREREIVSELACHLEEMYVDLRHAGASEEHALVVVSREGNNLGRTIRRLRWQREGGLRTWLRAVVLPGLILALVYAACCVAWGVYWEYPSSWLKGGLVVITVALGFCASSISRELGGTKVHRVWAAVVVVSLQAAAVCVMVFLVTPVEFVRNVQYREPTSGVVLRCLSILLWDVVTPIVVSVIGGVISIWIFSPASPDRSTRQIA